MAAEANFKDYADAFNELLQAVNRNVTSIPNMASGPL